MTGTLMAKTYTLLREAVTERSLPIIHSDLRVVGITDISYYWLRKFIHQQMKDPSVNRIQKLYEFLAERKLDV